MKSFESLKAIIQGAENDALRFYLKSNKAAGTRLRQSMQQVKLLAQEVRKSVLAKKAK